MTDQTIVSNVTAQNVNGGVRVYCTGHIDDIRSLDFDVELFQGEFEPLFQKFFEGFALRNQQKEAA